MTTSSKKPSFWVHNVTDNTNLLKTNVNEKWEIASLAKLIAAMVLLDDPAFDSTDELELSLEPITYDGDIKQWSPEEMPWTDGTPLVYNETIKFIIPKGTYTKDKLLRASLSPGDNYAIDTLARDYSGNFLEAMNTKAQALGLAESHFTSPHGCSLDDYATVQDVFNMAVAALDYDLIKEYTTLAQDEYRGLALENLNLYVMNIFKGSIDKVLLSKTGFSLRDGLHMILVIEIQGKVYSAIVLGSPNWEMRNAIMRKLMSTILYQASK